MSQAAKKPAKSRTKLPKRHRTQPIPSSLQKVIKGDNISLRLLTLARSARTSVEMIDRFYAKHLTAEMNIEQLQSNRCAPDDAAVKRSKPAKSRQTETRSKK